MDFDQLETFLEVARLSSFSRAAENRFRTQPAISAQIRALEEDVGAKLLDRSGGKVSITQSGKLFQKYAEETACQIVLSIPSPRSGPAAWHRRLLQAHGFAQRLPAACGSGSPLHEKSWRGELPRERFLVGQSP